MITVVSIRSYYVEDGVAGPDIAETYLNKKWKFFLNSGLSLETGL